MQSEKDVGNTKLRWWKRLNLRVGSLGIHPKGKRKSLYKYESGVASPQSRAQKAMGTGSLGFGKPHLPRRPGGKPAGRFWSHSAFICLKRGHARNKCVMEKLPKAQLMICATDTLSQTIYTTQSDTAKRPHSLLLHKAWSVWMLRPGEDHLPGWENWQSGQSVPVMVPTKLPVPPEAVLPGIKKSEFIIIAVATGNRGCLRSVWWAPRRGDASSVCDLFLGSARVGNRFCRPLLFLEVNYCYAERRASSVSTLEGKVRGKMWKKMTGPCKPRTKKKWKTQGTRWWNQLVLGEERFLFLKVSSSR